MRKVSILHHSHAAPHHTTPQHARTHARTHTRFSYCGFSRVFSHPILSVPPGIRTAEGLSSTSDLLDYIKEDLEGKLETTQSKIEADVDARIKAKLANKRLVHE